MHLYDTSPQLFASCTMSIDLSAENGPIFLDFEIYGPLTTDDLSEIVDHLDNNHSIQKIAIEIAAENPAVLELPTLIEKGDGDRSLQAQATDAEHRSRVENHPQHADSDDTSADQIPRLQSDGDPFAIMRYISHTGGWVRTREVADEIPSDWDVSNDSLGSNLWNLENRGLVEKRPYEEDKRQNEYRITDIGEQVLQDAIERVEELQPIE